MLLKRFGLLIVTNIAIITLLSLTLFAIEYFFWIDVAAILGQNYLWMFIYAAIFWFTGAFISLFLSKSMAKSAYGIVPISPDQAANLQWKQKLVYTTVVEISERFHIQTPEIGIYTSQDPNAFATWATKNSALVAVSTGLLDTMSEREIEWVVAHEMAHILNGDMVTMTLLQGVMNTFVIFFARIIAEFINSRTEGKLWFFWYMAVYIGLQILLGILASLVINAFSRWREYHADAWSARYVGKEKMIAALEALKKFHAPSQKDSGNFATMQINTSSQWWWKRLFMTHPSLDKRIRALEDMFL